MAQTAKKGPKPIVKKIAGTERIHLDLGHLGDVPTELMPKLKDKKPFQALEILEKHKVVDTHNIVSELRQEYGRLENDQKGENSVEKHEQMQAIENGLSILGVYHKAKSFGTSLERAKFRWHNQRGIRLAQEEMRLSFSSSHADTEHTIEANIEIPNNPPSIMGGYERLVRLHGQKAVNNALLTHLKITLDGGDLKISNIHPISVREAKRVKRYREQSGIRHDYGLFGHKLSLYGSSSRKEEREAVDGRYMVSLGGRMHFLLSPKGDLYLTGARTSTKRGFCGLKIQEYGGPYDESATEELRSGVWESLWQRIDGFHKKTIPELHPIVEKFKRREVDRWSIETYTHIWKKADKEGKARMTDPRYIDTFTASRHLRIYGQGPKRFLDYIATGTLPAHLQFLTQDDALQDLRDQPKVMGCQFGYMLGGIKESDLARFLQQKSVWDIVRKHAETISEFEFSHMIHALKEEDFPEEAKQFLLRESTFDKLLLLPDLARRNYLDALKKPENLKGEMRSILLSEDTLKDASSLGVIPLQENGYNPTALERLLTDKSSDNRVHPIGIGTYRLTTDNRFTSWMESFYEEQDNGQGNIQKNYFQGKNVSDLFFNEDGPSLTAKRAFIDNLGLFEGWTVEDFTVLERHMGGTNWASNAVKNILTMFDNKEKRSLLGNPKIRTLFSEMGKKLQQKFLVDLHNIKPEDIETYAMRVISAQETISNPELQVLAGDNTPAAKRFKHSYFFANLNTSSPETDWVQIISPETTRLLRDLRTEKATTYIDSVMTTRNSDFECKKVLQNRAFIATAGRTLSTEKFHQIFSNPKYVAILAKERIVRDGKKTLPKIIDEVRQQEAFFENINRMTPEMVDEFMECEATASQKVIDLAIELGGKKGVSYLHEMSYRIDERFLGIPVLASKKVINHLKSLTDEEGSQYIPIISSGNYKVTQGEKVITDWHNAARLPSDFRSDYLKDVARRQDTVLRDEIIIQQLINLPKEEAKEWMTYLLGGTYRQTEAQKAIADRQTANDLGEQTGAIYLRAVSQNPDTPLRDPQVVEELKNTNLGRKETEKLIGLLANKFFGNANVTLKDCVAELTHGPLRTAFQVSKMFEQDTESQPQIQHLEEFVRRMAYDYQKYGVPLEDIVDYVNFANDGGRALDRLTQFVDLKPDEIGGLKAA
ncbi:MAG: hypothetical protein ABH950_08825, partial [Candidatus Altiarchaeota archaeon]